MKIKYLDYNLRKETLLIVEKANEIIYDYYDQGYFLTVRQLYYQFISGDFLPESFIDPKTGSKNNDKSYKRLGDMLSKARLNGLIDWNAIEDRSRSVNEPFFWDSIPEIIASCGSSYSLDRWESQNERIECWVEKDALVEVVSKACGPYDVTYLACKGYYSQTAMHNAAKRIKSYKKPTTLLHLGDHDHDPSGIDMTRDIKDRLEIFGVKNLKVKRIALTMKQVKKYDPPPNPTKLKDSRSAGYIEKYGHECWELDALEPGVLVGLIQSHVEKIIDIEAFEQTKKEEEKGSQLIKHIAAEMSEKLEDGYYDDFEYYEDSEDSDDE